MNRYALGLVKSAEATMIIIPLNSNITINGYMDKKIPYHKVTVMVNQSTKTCIPDDVQATLHPYVYEDYQVFRVTINNVTTRTVSIPPKAVVCEIEPADIENFGRFLRIHLLYHLRWKGFGLKSIYHMIIHMKSDKRAET